MPSKTDTMVGCVVAFLFHRSFNLTATHLMPSLIAVLCNCGRAFVQCQLRTTQTKVVSQIMEHLELSA